MGGVAMLAKNPYRVVKHCGKTPEMRSCEALGRMAAYWVDVGDSTIFAIVIYGATGADHNTEAAELTQALIGAAVIELENYGMPFSRTPEGKTTARLRSCIP